jgi:hypothetical protein
MPRDLVIVGAGAYSFSLSGGSLEELLKTGEVRQLTFVDVEMTSAIERFLKFGERFRYVPTKKEEPLVNVVDRLYAQTTVKDLSNRRNSPIVLLAHPNELHYKDARSLMTDSCCRPSVLIEKPYALTDRQVTELSQLKGFFPNRVAFLEYYLADKLVPLELFLGLVKEQSFYFKGKGNLKLHEASSLEEVSGRFFEMIGYPLSMEIDVLEGQGSYSRTSHRNASLDVISLGGGMTLDLGPHAATAIVALMRAKDPQGRAFLPRYSASHIKSYRTGWAQTYLSSVQEQRSVPERDVAETYAEVLLDMAGIPVRLRMGKYLNWFDSREEADAFAAKRQDQRAREQPWEKGKNQRRVHIVGTRGSVEYNLTDNKLCITRGDSGRMTLVEAQKGETKYLPVLRAGLAELQGEELFTFGHEAFLQSMRMALSWAKLRPRPGQRHLYADGCPADEIFERRTK